MTRAEAIEILKHWKERAGSPIDASRLGYIEEWVYKEDIEALEMAIASLETDEAYQLEYEKPPIIDWNNCHTTETLISLDVYKQVCAERDIAIKQLHELGYEFGQKIQSTTKNDLGVDREDAVERLNAIKQFIGYDKDSEIIKATQKSLDMAIKALEHPEKNVIAVVPCGDAISRSDVLKLMQDNWHTHNGDWAMQESMDDIRALPSVTPQEPVLDKITEIIEPLRHLSIDEMSDIEWQILRVIDKHKAEVEPQESEG